MDEQVSPAADSWWRTGFSVIKAAAKEFGEDKGGRMAAALAYYSLFSLVPLLFLVTAVAGFFLDDPAVVEDLVAQAEDVVGSGVTEQITTLLEMVAASAGASLGIGVALAALSASGIFLQVQEVLNGVFHVSSPRVKGITGLLFKRAVALASAIGLALLVLAPIGAVGAIGWINRELVPDRLGWLRTILSFGVPIVSLLLLVSVVGLTFQVLTAERIPWKAAWRGGLFTAAVGLVGAFLVGTYLSGGIGGGEGGGVSTLAVVGGLAILLLFFNLMWTVYVFGAEVTKVYADYLAHGEVTRPSERERAEADRPAPVTPLTARDRLEEAGLLARTGVGAFLAGLVLGWWKRR